MGTAVPGLPDTGVPMAGVPDRAAVFAGDPAPFLGPVLDGEEVMAEVWGGAVANLTRKHGMGRLTEVPLP